MKKTADLLNLFLSTMVEYLFFIYGIPFTFTIILINIYTSLFSRFTM